MKKGFLVLLFTYFYCIGTAFSEEGTCNSVNDCLNNGYKIIKTENFKFDKAVLKVITFQKGNKMAMCSIRIGQSSSSVITSTCSN